MRLKILPPICVIGGIVMSVIGFQELTVARRLDSEGVLVPAQVVEHLSQSGRRGAKTYKLVTAYEPKEGGQSLRGEFKVPKAIFEATPDGGQIDVRYLPSDPKVAEVVGARTGGASTIGTGAFLGVIGVVAGYFGYRKRNQPVAPTPAATPAPGAR
jgi:hypothetical protein